MSDDRIEAEFNYKPRSIDSIFSNSFFFVPKYQRGYAWQSDEQVNDLLVDLTEAMTAYPDDFYLLGQIIVTSRETVTKATAAEEFEVVDGQQRLSTVFLILLALKKKIDVSVLKNSQNSMRLEAISTRLVDLDNSGQSKTRIELAPDGQEIIEKLLHNSPKELTKNILDDAISNSTTPSQENLLRAWLHINDFLDKEYKNDVDRFNLLEFITKQVVLVRLKVKDSSQALNIFWKTNDRGLDLDDADLLKNLLFISIDDPKEYGVVSENWAISSRALHSARLKRVKSMIFLMKALIGIVAGKSVPQNSVYKEWKKILDAKSQKPEIEDSAERPSNSDIEPEITSKDLTVKQRALNLSTKLPVSAESLRQISNCNSPVSKNSVKHLAHGSYTLKAIQHFQVLLAGDHLTATSYEELLKFVEDRVMLSLLSGESTQDFERVIHPWSNKIRGLEKDATLKNIQDASEVALENTDALFEIMKTTLPMLHYKRHYSKIRYVLARTTRFCEIHKAGESEKLVPSMVSLMDTTSDANGYSLQVDHIFPKASGRNLEWQKRLDIWRLNDLDSEVRGERDFINSIGNLTLLHSKENLDQSDSLPSEKAINYGGAQNKWITNLSLLDDSDESGSSPRYSDALVHIRNLAPVSLDSWNPDDVIKREFMLWNLLRDDLRRTLKPNE